jgi:hypothetical protein
MRNSVSLLVHTCDAYMKFWGGMLYTLDFYWDYDRIPVYFSSEDVSVDSVKFDCKGMEYHIDERINPILTGAGEFSDRFIKSLENIDTKWVIYIQEDMWLRGHLSPDLVDLLIDEAEKDGADAVKIHAALYYYDGYRLEKTGKYIQDKQILKYSQGENFLLTHNATIWNREYLLKHQMNGENPWSNEIKGSARMSSEPHNHLHYNINWYCQPGLADRGGYSSEFHVYAHIVDHMKYMNLKFGSDEILG